MAASSFASKMKIIGLCRDTSAHTRILHCLLALFKVQVLVPEKGDRLTALTNTIFCLVTTHAEYIGRAIKGSCPQYVPSGKCQPSTVSFT